MDRPSVDLNNKLFRAKELTKEDRRILIAAGYLPIRQTLGQGRGEYYFIRADSPNLLEGLEHQFFVLYIGQLLRQFTDTVETFWTRKPDIVFEDKYRNKVAIEVETGDNLSHRKKLENKVALLKKEYGSNYFFLVLHHLKLKQYVRYGEAITRMGLMDKILGYF
jgi:hypothetical protein